MAFPHVDIIMKQKDRILWIKNHCERLVELLSTDQNGLKDQVTMKRETYKKQKSIPSIRRQEHKDELNPKLKRMRINFLNCLYRYRTKAHYRDFIYLTADQYEPSIHKKNIYIDNRFIESLFLISNFSVCVALKYLSAKIGVRNTQTLLLALEGKLKLHNSPWNGFL